MKPRSNFFAPAKPIFCLFALLALPLLVPQRVNAQAAPVPATFQTMYTELDNYLINFNSTLGPGTSPAYPTLMTGALKAADSNVGPQLLNAMNGTQLSTDSAVVAQLAELKAMGVQAVMVEVGFPMLYEPFLTSQGQSYANFIAYYQGVAGAVRAAGLKLIVENDSLLNNDISAGWDVAPFYASLDWTQYQQARAQTALTIAQTMQPDYLVVVEEPDTEAANSGQSNVNTPSGDTAMLSLILTSLQQAGVPNMQVGAGVGSWLTGFLEFIQGFVTLPVDFIDFHIYPVNDSFLPNALQIVSTAAAAGKPVAMTECWLAKEADSEVGILTDDVIRARNPFSFWAPLDALFIQTMQNLANNTQMIFMDPFNAEFYFVYQPYDASTENLTPSQIVSQENALVATANQQAQYSSTGLSYYSSIIVPADTAPPSAPGSLTAASGNPTSALVTWAPATDNVGVAGYNLLRDGQIITTTNSMFYQDSGLTDATTYTYTVQAFDLAGNTTTSAPVNIQTTNVIPPTTPGHVVAKVLSCTSASVTWTASTGKTGVAWYLVFMGLSPSGLSQVSETSSSTLTYSNYTLSPGTTYYIALEAEDSYENISYMSTPVAFTTAALPAAPGSVLATPAATTKIGVTWSASTGSFPIALYFVYRGSSPSSLSKVATVTGTSYTDLSVTPSTTYYYAIQAQDKGTPPAQSGFSNPVAATTFAPPGTPANLVAQAESCTRVSVTWSAAVSGGLPIANYRVYKGTSPSNMTQVAIATKTSYTDNTNSAQTTYYYAVQAADKGVPQGFSGISPPVSVTTYGDPSVPANLAATVVSSSKITLTWSASTSGGLPIASYHVYSGTSPSSLSQIAVASGTSYNNTKLTAGTTYYYAVQAVDTLAEASALSSPVSATTFPLPSTPSNVVAQGTKTTQIAVSWSPSNGALAIARYLVFRGTSPSSMSQVATALNTSYKDSSVSSGTTYYYAVQAVDTGADVSALSSPISGTTLQ
jgi:fibronectin type 3 domain-containing protein